VAVIKRHSDRAAAVPQRWKRSQRRLNFVPVTYATASGQSNTARTAQFHANGMTRTGARSLSLACVAVELMNGRENGHA
jgi:hypothetical protein